MLAQKKRLRRESAPNKSVESRLEAIEQDEQMQGRSLGDLAEWQRFLSPGKVHGYHEGGEPPKATSARPGSDDKLLVMQWRAKHGYALHHEGDAKLRPGEPDGRGRESEDEEGEDKDE
jgi:hypothetical protein